MTQTSPLRPLAERLCESNAVSAARVLEAMDAADALAAFEQLPEASIARAARHLHPTQVIAILRDAPPVVFARVVGALDPQHGAAVLCDLPPEARTRFLDALDAKTKRALQELLEYPADSAGRIMSTSFIAIRDDTHVRDAVQHIRSLAHKRALTSYTYVIDGEDRLVGVVNMFDLVLADPDAMIETVMRRDVYSVDAFTDRETVAHELAARKFFVAPVVDPQRRMLGIVKSDQLLGDAHAQATEDLQKMFGAGGDERAFSTVAFSLKKRVPWLHVNLATAFLAASVVALFEDVIARITVLAVFLPVVAGQGGNAGAQSLAVVMRGLVMREIPPGRVRELLFKEAAVGAANGLVIGLSTAIIAWLWVGNPYLGVVIGLAMVVNLLAAGFAGAAIPLTMRALGIDPAQSSSIVLTTVTDIVGFVAYLGFAVLFESKLLPT